MQTSTIRAWSWVHKWTSLFCTLFLLMLCLTGLPLIFHDEIDSALNPPDWQPANPGGEVLSLDEILDVALRDANGARPLFMSFDTERPVINVTTQADPDVTGSQFLFKSYDATSGDLVPPADKGGKVMDFILQVHTDLFLGLPGMLFLGFMGFLFILAVVSGVVLYAPFMRKLDFGTVRAKQSTRLKWLDYHNLFGVVTLAWVLVVGITGIINTLEEPIVETWKKNDLKDLIAAHQTGQVVTAQASLDAAVKQAVAAAPEKVLQFVAFPGSSYSTQSHYAIFLHGNTPLTENLVTPVLVDAVSGDFVGLREMPWYSKALSLSRPLHFGDYGGLFLKTLWTLLDIITLIVLISGLYLWLSRRGRKVVIP